MKTEICRCVFVLLVAINFSFANAGSVFAAESCCVTPADDFPKVGGNLGNQNYSSLTQINLANISRLGGHWQTRLEPDSAPLSQQSTAVAVDGVLFVETTQGNVYAVHGDSGAIKWSYTPGHGTSLRRGVAVGEGMVFSNAVDRRVIALDQENGKLVWEITLDEPTVSSQMKVAVVYHDGLVYVGTNDGARGVAVAIDAKTGEVVWKFYGTPGTGEFGSDTWPGNSWQDGGAAPWMHPAIDPELGLVYWTFGNPRTARGAAGRRSDGAVNGANREGANLFANSIVALDAKTGERRWHFQSVHHDIWDLDNVMAPVLVDLQIDGKPRKAVIYGSKTGLTYILDRVDGSALIGIEEKPVPQEPAQKTWPTQPYPVGDPLVPLCADPDADDATRAPPNYGVGCLFTPHTDFPIVKSPGTGGGADWSAQSFSSKTGLIYIGAGLINSAHSVPTAGVGFRPIGESRSGRIVAKDPTTNRIAWHRDIQWSVAHGNGILSTAGDLLFIGMPDGNLLALNSVDGSEVWRFQTGAGVHTSPISYLVDGVQYVAVFSGGNRLPYNSPQGDYLWAFRLDGKLPQASAPEAPPVRQPIFASAVAGAVANFTVTLGRTWNSMTNAPGSEESSAQSAMAPLVMTVPVGTTVVFRNPDDNVDSHCASQFFEGLFDIGPLQPGESEEYTFTERGEFFFNDCTNPQSTGKIVVE
ncbi:MAG: PQQ-binding-like beta-propeller repeat protein [Gammaproteobacteria bacterium]|nr:PQQ-binding-like beta-propeller repeat protein [Gammaproteobacteria bacterium]